MAIVGTTPERRWVYFFYDIFKMICSRCDSFRSIAKDDISFDKINVKKNFLLNFGISFRHGISIHVRLHVKNVIVSDMRSGQVSVESL